MSEFTNGNLSPWGYIIDAENLPDLLTTTDFANYTNGKFGMTDSRIATNIKSATASIRNFCGWHISPSLTCGMVYRVADLRDAFIGRDLLVQLPATFVTEVSKIVINAVLDPETNDYVGDLITDFDIGMGNGIVRIYDVANIDRKSKIFIKYKAGLPNSQIDAIKEIAANGVIHSLTNTYGVASEAAGGVSVSYTSSWTGKGSTSLANDTREVLDPYRVKGVF